MKYYLSTTKTHVFRIAYFALRPSDIDGFDFSRHFHLVRLQSSIFTFNVSTITKYKKVYTNIRNDSQAIEAKNRKWEKSETLAQAKHKCIWM